MSKRELVLSDSFHRTKRTLLIFCSAIIITRIPTIDAAKDQVVLGIAMSNFDIRLIRTLLYVSASYYMVGFILEAITERQSHSEILRYGGMGKLKSDVHRFWTEVIEKRDAVGRSIEQLQLSLDEIKRKLDLYGPYVYPNSGPPTHAPHLNPESAAEPAVEMVMDVQIAIDSSKDRLHEIPRQIENLDSKVIDLNRNFRRLSRDIFQTRRFHFYVWEIGGATSIFVFATLLILVDPSPAITSIFPPPAGSTFGSGG